MSVISHHSAPRARGAGDEYRKSASVPNSRVPVHRTSNKGFRFEAQSQTAQASRRPRLSFCPWRLGVNRDPARRRLRSRAKTIQRKSNRYAHVPVPVLPDVLRNMRLATRLTGGSSDDRERLACLVSPIKHITVRSLDEIRGDTAPPVRRPWSFPPLPSLSHLHASHLVSSRSPSCRSSSHIRVDTSN